MILLLLDGMSSSILARHLAPDGFFRRNLRCSYSSTFPPTTVAATTPAHSGLFPNQSAWLDWTGYFPDINRNVICFQNADAGEAVGHVANTYLPYKSVPVQVTRAGTKAHFIAPFLDPHPQSYAELCQIIKQLCDTEQPNYLYAYWHQPDETMHLHGTDSPIVHRLLIELEAATEQLAASLSDTLLLITADHGHINVKNKILIDYPDLCRCLVRMPSTEPRAVNFFVKPEMAEQFGQAFQKHFGDAFLLMTKAEVLSSRLLGSGVCHPKLNGMLGDYLAVAVDDTAIRNIDDKFVSSYAGLTKDEMIIPLIAVEKP